MPHLIVEYSSTLSALMRQTDLLTALHQHVCASELFSPEAVKARALAYQDVKLPEGRTDFVHISCAILSGRSEQQCRSLSVQLFDCAKQRLPESTMLSVEIRQMDRASYVK